ncbi:MAG: TlpA disulfide reductase family protein [Planctomycetota bacterium]
MPESEVELPADSPGGTMTLPPGDVPDPDSVTPKKSPGEGGMSLPTDFDPSQQGAIDIRFSPWDAIAEMAASTGKVTVVDLWSLACGPCLKEYPSLVRLHDNYSQTLQAIGANLDYDGRKTRPPEYYEPRVREFLSSVSATFPNFIIETPSEDVLKSVGIASIPSVLVFDADGRLVRQFADQGDTAGFTYESHVRPLVQQLLSMPRG